MEERNVVHQFLGDFVTMKQVSSYSHVKLPDWVRNRPFLSKDMNCLLGSFQGDVKDLSEFNAKEKEIILLEDILAVMKGIEGTYIFLESEDHTNYFVMHHSLDTHARSIIERILPLCNQYLYITGFLEEYSKYQYGFICHAFCSAIEVFIRDYKILVAQLENCQDLTIQKTMFYIQPSAKTMKIIYYLMKSIEENATYGGSLINLIHQLSVERSGDSRVDDIYKYILENVSRPYLEMLVYWLYHGTICDPYNEFFICENDIGTDVDDIIYWNQKFSLKKNNILTSLMDNAQRILSTGKYFNVLREYGKLSNEYESLIKNIQYSHREEYYSDYIQEAYFYSSSKIMRMLIDDYDLVGRLKSIKHYFFLDQGDFLVHFFDIAEDEINKPASSIDREKLQTLLEISIKASVTKNDPYNEDVKCKLQSYTLLKQIKYILSVSSSGIVETTSDIDIRGVEAFCLDYEVNWPLSIVISSKTMVKYQLLFRFFFYVKYVSRLLNTSWKEQQNIRQYEYELRSNNYLRQKMAHFVNQLEYYMMFEVIEPAWGNFMHDLQNAETLDTVVKSHDEFLDICLRQCMLTESKLLDIIMKTLSVCHVYTYTYVNRIVKNWLNDDGHEASEPERYLAIANAADSKFTGNLNLLLKGLNMWDNYDNHISS
eukprot:TRINITY_DN7486_c0_g1_i4.p1 TRINITY_DN7486_c0_g1~~TRINITY_DN7486_c0_g1_i4.p1  ORF type:complete len:655 (-),score=111.85 TRINITY_DN7486_c0_g1_i4:1776-3740(-)